MRRQTRRLLTYVALVAVAAVGYAVLYMVAMGVFEGRPRSFLQSLVVAVQTFTTVGYGGDAPWSHPVTQLLVITMQISGVLLVFAALPLLLVPYLEDRLAVSPPDSVSLRDHVVVCGFSSRGQSLVEELVETDVPYVVVAEEPTATELVRDGYRAVAGDPEAEADLRRAGVDRARAVVLDAGDERNAAIALAVQDLAPEVETISFVQDPSLREYLTLAGVDRVLSPRELLGQALADRVTSALTTRLGSPIEVGEDFQLVEMPVGDGAPLDGVQLADSGIRERTGADVVGAWVEGTFESNPGPDFRITGDTALVAAGSRSALSALKELTLPPDRSGPERVVLVGYGEVGSAAREAIEAAGLAVTVVDIRDRPGVDVVGDATEQGTLTDAGLTDAQAYIAAIPDDTETVFATLVARQLAPDVEILCRATDEDRVQTMYSAGADYVIALGAVSGRMLAASLLDEEVIGIDTQIEVVRVRTDTFDGETLAEADIRARTGCTVIAVERDGELVTGPAPDFTLRATDVLVVAGTDDDITRFNEVADVGAAEPR